MAVQKKPQKKEAIHISFSPNFPHPLFKLKAQYHFNTMRTGDADLRF